MAVNVCSGPGESFSLDL